MTNEEHNAMLARIDERTAWMAKKLEWTCDNIEIQDIRLRSLEGFRRWLFGIAAGVSGLLTLIAGGIAILR